ncbi:hypothetical protein [Halanaerobium praevalens]|uniref:hypothetical protein n=1 Tax=Halanaerobium praevalens TaxID=2331 RepID=UPI0002D551DE|nr:hypothetical protein [Halanaerobium praevalens]
MKDLISLEEKQFIDPSDMAKLKEIERSEIVIPLKNTALKTENSIINSIIRIIFDYFNNNPEEESERFIETLYWFIFREYKEKDSKDT